jgi:hypothetical protein
MALYKYVPIETLKRILGGTIRLTQPGAFNDPFEMLPEIHVPPDFARRQVSLSFSVTAPRRPYSGAVSTVPADDFVSRDLVAQLNRAIGVFCMSRNPSSLTMWAHYADEYRGALIEFDDTHDFFKGAVEIEYCRTRPVREFQAYLDARMPIPVSEFCHKAEEWAYENEVRVIRCLADCKVVGDGDTKGFPIYVMDLPLDCIKSVTLGERSLVEHQRVILDVLAPTSVSLNLAAVAHSGYEFRTETIKFAKPLSEVGPMISPRTAHIFRDRSDDLGEAARWAIDNHPLSALVSKKV